MLVGLWTDHSSSPILKSLSQLLTLKKQQQAEKETSSHQEQKTAKSALTELFLELKTDSTPVIVERIVNDIDEIVRLKRYEKWQDTSSGLKLIAKELRKIIWVKYQIKDEDLYNRAYDYIKEYY